MKVLMIYLILINIIGLTMMYTDKRRAVKGKYRIPEKRLWGTAVIGGAIGCSAGMYFFRHKTKHWSFKFGFPVLALVQCVLLVKLWTVLD